MENLIDIMELLTMNERLYSFPSFVKHFEKNIEKQNEENRKGRKNEEEKRRTFPKNIHL